jgi:hypothetical protein
MSCNRYILELLKRDIKPRDIMTYKAFENAMVTVMATGGSTNAVMHYIAMARAAGVPLSLDDWQRISDKVRCCCCCCCCCTANRCACPEIAPPRHVCIFVFFHRASAPYYCCFGSPATPTRPDPCLHTITCLLTFLMPSHVVVMLRFHPSGAIHL